MSITPQDLIAAAEVLRAQKGGPLLGFTFVGPLFSVTYDYHEPEAAEMLKVYAEALNLALKPVSSEL